MLSTNRDTLTVSLPICIPFIPFISCSHLITLARNSRSMLNRSGESGYPCLISDFMGNGFSFSSLSMMLAIGLSYIAFIMLRHIPSTPSFLRVFIMEWCWIYWDDQVVFVFALLICCITFIDLLILNHLCIPGVKQTWTWWVIFLICSWILFAIILLRIFALIFMKEICLYFSILYLSLSNLGWV
jgi:hypothetical protein